VICLSMDEEYEETEREIAAFVEWVKVQWICLILIGLSIGSD